MSAKGARYIWKNGNILHASRYWKSPTMRRLPRILIEDRALEVGLLVYIEDMWIVFQETTKVSSSISMVKASQLEFYVGRYHLLPSMCDGIDTYQWLKQKNNALLVWGVGSKYYCLITKR